MLRDAYCQLKADALVSGQQREIAMGSGRPDDLQPTVGLERSKRSDQISLDAVKQIAESDQSAAPELHQRQQVAVGGFGQRGRSLVAGCDPLVEESLHFGDEEG